MTDAPRRDPRKDRAAPRRAAAQDATSSPAPDLAPVTREWSSADRARCLVVLEVPGGALTSLDRALLGAARTLAGADALVVAIAFVELRDDIHAAGADAVLSLPAAGGFRPAARVAALSKLRSELRGPTILLGEAGDGADLGRRLAIVLDVPLATDVVAIEGSDVVRNPGRSETEWVGAETPVMLLSATAFAPCTGPRRTPVNLPIAEFDTLQESAIELRTTTAGSGAVALEEARFIISGGAGVSDWSLFERLGQTLRAARGGSRVVCDAGSIARERQIGASGTSVTADCYLALGISGAPQHLSGIERCGYVIAVNSDRQAPIFRRANLGFVADAHELMRAVVELDAQRGVP